jgi:hypothetical protein
MCASDEGGGRYSKQGRRQAWQGASRLGRTEKKQRGDFVCMIGGPRVNGVS